jgi:hypothetical protein
VNAVSEFNQRAYELFLRPWVQALASEPAARLQRAFHPLRWQRWAMSDLNPATWWLAPAAQWAKEHRQSLDADHPARRSEAALSDLTSATLDSFKAVRDAAAEATFFHLYGPLHAAGVGKRGGESTNTLPSDPRQLPFVQAALARVDSGGYAEAAARVAFLMAHEEVPLPLSRLQLAHELLKDYRQFLPALAPDELRRIAGEQEVIARLERDRAIEALPSLLADPQERLRLIALIERVLADERVHAIEPSAEQRKTLAHIRRVLGVDAPKKKSRRLAAAAA